MGEKKRILHILNSNSYSGAENVVITIIENMKDTYDCAYLSPRGPISKVLAEKDIPYIAVEKLSVRTIRQAIADFQPDLIHAHDFRAGMLSCLTGTHISLINHLHNNSPWLKHFSPWTIAYAFCCRKFDRILTVSASVMDEFIFGKYFQNKTKIVGNPVDLKKIQLLADESTLKDGSDIIFLGRLTPQKNPYFFLKVMNRVVKKIPDVQIAVVGDGELRSQFESQIKEYHLEHNVKMYGFQSNPYGLVQNSKVMCMPSLWEGFGLAAVEALCLGIPVVCSGAGGLSDFIDEQCGMICGEDLEKYVDEIIKLLSDESYRRQKSKVSKIQAEHIANIRPYIESILEQYNYCLK